MDIFYNSLKNADADKLELLSNEIFKINENNEDYWKFIIQNSILDDKIILKNLNRIDIRLLISRQKLSKDLLKNSFFLEKISDKCIYNQVIQDQQLDMDLLEFYIKKYEDINWLLISKYQNLSITFMETYLNNLEWDEISQSQFMTLEFILKNKDVINWSLIGQNIKLEFLFNDSFVEIFSDKDVSNILVWSNNISNEYLLKNIDNLSFDKIIDLLEYKKLDDNVINYITNSYKDNKQIYQLLSEHQNLSFNFIKNNLSNLNLELIIENQDIDLDFIKANFKDIKNISYNENLSEDLLIELYNIKHTFNDDLDWDYISEFGNLTKKSLTKIKELNKELILENINIKLN